MLVVLDAQATLQHVPPGMHLRSVQISRQNKLKAPEAESRPLVLSIR